MKIYLDLMYAAMVFAMANITMHFIVPNMREAYSMARTTPRLKLLVALIAAILITACSVVSLLAVTSFIKTMITNFS